MPYFIAAKGYRQVGELLCHYTTADAALNHILPERRLRMSPYISMRDPLEAKQWPISCRKASPIRLRGVPRRHAGST
jgi:hypothetical protein